jgi:hypothetical protein
MNVLTRFAAACILSLTFSLAAVAAPVFGSYRGVVKNEKLSRDQLVKLELIHSRADAGGIKLRAILTLQFGGYDSGEYVSYHFEDVAYNIVNGVLTFNQNDQEVHLSSVRIKDGELTGDMHAAVGLVGPFRLSNKAVIRPENPLVEPLGGEYQGRCGKVPSSMQLMTFRSTKDTTRLGNPFGVYEAKGQLANYNPSYCASKRTDFCTYSKIESASYNFFVGDLVLNGYPFGLNCAVEGSTLRCGECTLKRASDEMKKPSLAPATFGADPIPDIRKRLKEDTRAPLKGQYAGYLFHEQLGMFQRVEMDVATYDQPTDSGTQLIFSATANARFGTSDNEVISYRFNPTEFPNPVLAPQFVLSRPEADVDAVLSIRSIKGGVIQGVWYSMIFGKVGSFVVTKNGDLPELPSDKLFGSVSSGYEEVGGAGVISKVLVGKGNAPIGSDNPFDPLNFGGYVWRRSGTTQKEGIDGGSYDFYTGKIAILFGDNKALNGFLIPGQEPYLRRLGGGFGTIMQSFGTSRYKRSTRLP